MVSSWDGLRLFRLGATTGVNTTNLILANNKATGVYDSHLYINDASQEVGLSVRQNLMGVSGYKYGTGAIDLSAQPWFTDNLTSGESWRLSWGGDASLTGIALSPQGLAPIGRHDVALPDPVIGSDTPGWETPAAALSNLTELGLSGVSLTMARKTAADEAALDDWMLDAIAAGQEWASGAGAVLNVTVVPA
jgi:hypothetical protein